jgi:four helix bundle protein
MGRLIRKFEDIEAWQLAVDLAASVYHVTSEGPFARDFRLISQIQRAAVSISSNIAEGFERDSRRDFRRFLSIAKGSCAEVQTQVAIARRVNYISEETYQALILAAKLVNSKIGRLRASISVPTSHQSLVTSHDGPQ